MRTGLASSQLFLQFPLKLAGDGVLQLLGFVMNLIPFHAEDFGQHSLNQVMAVQYAIGDFAAIRG